MEHIKQQTPASGALSSHIFLVLVALFPLAFAALLTVVIKTWVPFSTIGADSEFATISAPLQNQSIQRNYQSSGVIKQSFDGDRHLFIVEQSTAGTFPKAPINDGVMQWSMNLYTGAPVNNDFRLMVVTVDSADRDRFYQWFKHGESTGKYPGIDDIPSLQELSAVTVRVGQE